MPVSESTVLNVVKQGAKNQPTFRGGNRRGDRGGRTESSTSTPSAAAATGKVKSKADVEKAKAQKGFGGTGDPWAPGENATLEDFFARFGPGMMEGQTSAGEFNEAMGPGMQTPGMGEQQIAGSLGAFNLPSASEQQFAAAQRGGAGLDPYYDRARETTMASMDQALAARGAFGSSMGVGAIGNAMASLGAEQANREADFMQQAAQQADQQKLGRLGLGGELALGGQEAGQDRFATGLQGAMGADAMEISRFNTVANVAAATQAASQGRIQDWLGNVMKTSQMGSDMVVDAWQNMADADRGLWEQEMAIELQIPVEQLRQMLANQAQSRQDFGETMEAVGGMAESVGNIAGGVGGGGGGARSDTGGGGGGARTAPPRWGMAGGGVR